VQGGAAARGVRNQCFALDAAEEFGFGVLLVALEFAATYEEVLVGQKKGGGEGGMGHTSV
jgi:hypothetical protein